MGPFGPEDALDKLIRATREVGHLVRVLDGGGRRLGDQDLAPGWQGVGEVAVQSELAVLGPPPHLPGSSQIVGVDPKPGADRDRVAAGQVDGKQYPNERPDALDL